MDDAKMDDVVNTMTEVVRILKTSPTIQGADVEFPGFIEVIDSRGRCHAIGFDGQEWAIDTYRNMDRVIEGHLPDTSGCLPVPNGTTDPATVAAAIVRYTTQP